MSEWQPIDTAPKNGAAILVAFSWRMTPLASAGIHAVVWRADRPGWYLAALNSVQLDHCGVDEDDAADATHWKPLPDTPDAPLEASPRQVVS